MVETGGAFLLGAEHARHAVDGLNRRTHRAEQRRIIHVNVRDLVIGDREGLAGAAIEQLEAELFLDREPALGAEDAVQRDRAPHRRDAVFREHDRAHAALRVEIHQPARHAIDRAAIFRDPRIVGTEALEIVVKVRQVNEREIRLVFLLNPLR